MLNHDQIVTVTLRIREIKDKDPAKPEPEVITLYTLTPEASTSLPSPPEVILNADNESHFELVGNFGGIFHARNRDRIRQETKNMFENKVMRIRTRSYNIRLGELLNILADAKKLEWV